MLSVLVLILSATILVVHLPGAAASSTYGTVSVQGSEILVDGQTPSDKFYGVVDTTALQFAILTYIYGETQYAGKTSVFNGPDTGNYGPVSPNDTPAHFFDRYFALLAYYHCNLVRIGAGDSWGTGIQYDAWMDHHDAFVSLLKTMEAAAEAHDVWVVLVLAGSQDYPTYQFGGSGSVFEPSSSAYRNYIAYSNDVMASLTGLKGIGWFDLFNEPDHDFIWTKYWSSNGGKTAFHAWACSVANDTAGRSSHPRTMGVAGLGLMFGWGKTDFDLCTGTVPFEIASRHYYASNSDMNNFATPEQWAKADGKPLFWGELAYNAVYPLIRYDYAEQAIYANGGQIITSMVLTGTDNYPFVGNTFPTASFTVTPTVGNSSTVFAFDASSCTDPEDAASNLQVRWDWTSDGTYDTAWATSKTATHSFSHSGTYTVSMQVMNTIGLVNTTTKTVTVDADGPLLSITSPTNGTIVGSRSVNVEWSGADSGSGVVNYLVRMDGGAWTTLSSTADNYTFSSVADGRHTLQVRAVDDAGNTIDASVSVVVDVDAPTVTITSPSSGSVITAPSQTVSWSGSDVGSGVANYLVKVDGGAWATLSPSTTSYICSGLAQGSHTVTVRAVDNVGNYKDATVTFVVSNTGSDITAPSLTITSPQDGSTITETHPTITWTASDASGIAYYQIVRDGGSWAQLSSGQTSYTTVMELADGSHTVTVRAVDKAGNYRDATTTFTVSTKVADTTPPSLIISSPANGATVSDTHPTVTWTASDASGIAYYQIVRDGGNWVTLPSSQTSYTTQNALADGQHTMTVRAVDNAGNYKDATVVFTVSTYVADTTPPSLTITSPANGATIADKHATITWSASDASGIAYYDIMRDGGNWVQLPSSQTSYTTVDALAQGSHTVTVRAVDGVGNYRDVTTVFTVGTAADTTPPSLTITSPANGATIADKHATITWSASDASGIAYYQIVRDGGAWVQLPSGQTSYTTVNELADGTHTVTVRAVDNAGNYKDVTTVFTVSTTAADTTPPSLTIISPTYGATVTATHPTISWTASDASGIAYYQIIRDGGNWVRLSSGQTSYTTVDALAQGSHTVTVRAVDGVGNYRDVTTVFTVGTALSSNMPSLSITSPADGASVSGTSATVTWSGSASSGIAHYYVQLDNGIWTQLYYLTNSYTYHGLWYGSHTVAVKLVDNAGNTMTAKVTFVVR